MEHSGPTLVLGATSLIGRFLLPRLAAAGAEVFAISRAARPSMPGVQWIEADLTSPDWAAKMPPAATVFALMPIWLLPPALPALAGADTRRLIAFSSTSVFTKTASPEPSERDVAHRLLRIGEAVAASGLAWTILRPTMIYAEGLDANVSRLAGLIARWKVLPLSGRGGGLRQPVHADDLASGALAAAASDAAIGKSYDLPGGETLSYREMARRLFEAQGLPPRILTVPPPLWRLALTLAAPLLPGATGAMGDRMAEDLTFDPVPATRDFGWAPRGFRPQF